MKFLSVMTRRGPVSHAKSKQKTFFFPLSLLSHVDEESKKTSRPLWANKGRVRVEELDNRCFISEGIEFSPSQPRVPLKTPNRRDYLESVRPIDRTQNGISVSSSAPF
jgi:hypothetical protein